MASIHFVGTYPPIRCGIADYTCSITENNSAGKWAVLSFRLDNGELPVAISDFTATENIWYGIPGPRTFSASVIRMGSGNSVSKLTKLSCGFSTNSVSG